LILDWVITILSYPAYCFKNCNIFTIVEGHEGRVMSDELKILIELLTARILKAFLSFVPNWDPLNSGPPLFGGKHQLFSGLPFSNFLKYFQISFKGAAWGAADHSREMPSRKSPTFGPIQRGFVPIQRGFGPIQTGFGPP